eukprot:4785431-Alexandrium_andersonii.AAC.1
MSASLVGSEMCIRDSDANRPPALPETNGAGDAVRPKIRRGWRRGRGPVSYTHLTLPTICSV